MMIGHLTDAEILEEASDRGLLSLGERDTCDLIDELEGRGFAVHLSTEGGLYTEWARRIVYNKRMGKAWEADSLAFIHEIADMTNV